MKTNQEELHRILASELYKKGERFPKKHGEWIRMKTFDNLWLVMDSWNKAIHVCKGEPVYDNMYTGFKKNKVEYVGMDFGGYSRGSGRVVFWLQVVNNTYTEQNDE